ncbi:MAG TPA: type VI secretion system tip protein VgrG [Blastocatellia bacterium]|nr:type VI secretion system tip protein VgrG [Blastocatellia bacterium]
MPTYTQANRPLAVTTPLGKDVLLLIGLAGREAISQLFNFHLDLLAEDSSKVKFEELLGHKITVTFKLPNDRERYFSGICNRVSQGGRSEGDIFTSYRMEVVPAFWLLSKRAQSRIFQHITVPDILKKVLTGLDVSFEIQGTFHPRDFCVQYRESDFDFASRLMEEEGIFYFFKHTADGHKMVVANTPDSHPKFGEKSEAKIIYEEAFGGRREEERILSWEKTQELRSGKYTLWDHCFELPHKHLEAEVEILDAVQAGTVSQKLRVGGNDRLELYDYPGAYAQRFDGVNKSGGDQAADLSKIFEDNKRTTKIRMQAETVPGLVLQGTSNCRHLVTGYQFTLERHFDADGDYVLTAIMHSARLTGTDYRSGDEGEFDYENRFTCIPFSDVLPFRPAQVTVKPTVKGTQTAVVVGPPGEEIFTDKYGRVKVQFHWDREGKNNADSSCWVRVAQLWAGKRWGTSFWPRIGQEVIVDFLEGDPDQPIIVGSVYNADQMPPYLGQGPDSKHQNDNKVSGVKTNTTKGGQGFNELRFDDTKGKEQVFIHAECNMDTRVKNDCMERIVANRHLIVGAEKDGSKSGDQLEKVYQDKHLQVDRDQIEHIGNNMELLIDNNLDVAIKANKAEHIASDSDLNIGKDHREKIDGTSSLTVARDLKEKIDLSASLNVGMNQDQKIGMNHALEAGLTIHLKSGMTFVLEAGVQMSLKVGGNFIDINPAGIFIQGTMVMINSGGAPGSGPSANPQAPDAARDAKEAKPTVPNTADDSKSGQKSAPS